MLEMPSAEALSHYLSLATQQMKLTAANMANIDTPESASTRSGPMAGNRMQASKRWPICSIAWKAPPAAASSRALSRRSPRSPFGIRNLMFTFEDLLTVPAASIRELVNAADKRVLALAQIADARGRAACCCRRC